MTEKEERENLFKISEKEYGGKYYEQLFEQYKLYLEKIDNLIRRRTLANNFFLGINTGLLSALAFLFNLGITTLNGNGAWIMGGSAGGILFAYAWLRTVASYKQLSKVKWTLVIDIEKKLPVNLHDVEWKLLGEGNDKKKYRPLTDVEQYVPKIFIGFYSLLIVVAFLILGQIINI